jgi:hypothetical protein
MEGFDMSGSLRQILNFKEIETQNANWNQIFS